MLTMYISFSRFVRKYHNLIEIIYNVNNAKKENDPINEVSG